jgi:pyruvate kinase
VAFSQSGFTARLVARYRPPAPIVASPGRADGAAGAAGLGVRPVVAKVEVDSPTTSCAPSRQLLEARLVAPGRILILMGHPVRERPLTNLMRVHKVRAL